MKGFNDSWILAQTASEAFRRILAQVLKEGVEVDRTESSSITSDTPTLDLLGSTTRVLDPLQRITSDSNYSFDLGVACARAIWLLTGSDRLADIEFYQPRADNFSDDGVTIPGSSYGRRILFPRPGLNQLEAMINRLRSKLSSRRAFLSIATPEDSARNSRDIPCALSLIFHIRESKLHTHLIMRANNAYSLFPYNFFEFSLLAELVAAELDCELGTLSHYAMSMHVTLRDLEAVRALVESELGASPDTSTGARFRSGDFTKIAAVARLESRIRNESATASNDWTRSIRDEVHRTAPGQWSFLLNALLVYALRLRGRPDVARCAAESVPLHCHSALLLDDH